MSMNSNNNTYNKSGRIEYIDALRGFTMILVVFYHVSRHCWQINNLGISINDFLVQIRMPMFFFISGFVLFKAGVIWDMKYIVHFFRKKIPVQLIFPFIFWLVLLQTKSIPIASGIFGIEHVGYWFTYVLFEYYVFYAIIMFIFKNNKSSILLLLLGLFLYFINYQPIYNLIPLSEYLKVFFNIPNWNFFLFFVLGTISRKHFLLVERLIDHKWVLSISISFYFLVNGFREIIPIPDTYISLPRTITGLLVLFSFFKIHQSSFSKNYIIGKSLQYIGRRTLDIYLIHFFLIPDNLNYIRIFTEHPMPIIEATVSFLISLIIVAACLLIGSVIRLSPLLAHWVFGAKYPNINK